MTGCCDAACGPFGQPLVLPNIPSSCVPASDGFLLVLKIATRIEARLHRGISPGAVVANLGSVRFGDIGVVFEIVVLDKSGVIVDLSSAPTKQIIFGRPLSGSKVKNADFVTDGSDGRLRYKTVVGDLDQLGQWRVQAHIILPTFVDDFRTEIATFFVEPALDFSESCVPVPVTIP